MADISIEDRHFARYLQAKNLFDDDPDQCMAQAKELLNEHELSHGVRIRTLILIACATEDWYEAEQNRRAAEGLWKLCRELWPRGDPQTDGDETEATLVRFRRSLDELEDWQSQQVPGLFSAQEEAMVEHEVEMEEGIMEALAEQEDAKRDAELGDDPGEDQDELDAADRAILGDEAFDKMKAKEAAKGKQKATADPLLEQQTAEAGEASAIVPKVSLSCLNHHKS